MTGPIYLHRNGFINELVMTDECVRPQQKISGEQCQRHVDGKQHFGVVGQLSRQNQSSRRCIYQTQCQIKQDVRRLPRGSPLVADPSLPQCPNCREQDDRPGPWCQRAVLPGKHQSGVVGRRQSGIVGGIRSGRINPRRLANSSAFRRPLRIGIAGPFRRAAASAVKRVWKRRSPAIFFPSLARSSSRTEARPSARWTRCRADRAATYITDGLWYRSGVRGDDAESQCHGLEQGAAESLAA